MLSFPLSLSLFCFLSDDLTARIHTKANKTKKAVRSNNAVTKPDVIKDPSINNKTTTAPIHLYINTILLFCSIIIVKDQRERKIPFTSMT
ncbi:hypothetical protein C9J48_10775 [Photobacterium profundum]|uniref:Uncharacterized protein n=1 Tax=Photobacterium profundum 3TCK TaxID=314280 RepID=Q1YYE8_9GAMM|nr:hypothetical protein P3TCK_08883 [Photobacterium profundum 3TCK]PSV62442.1 hypothetical protein C9J48_10775 [Photobacterium profundum]